MNDNLQVPLPLDPLQAESDSAATATAAPETWTGTMQITPEIVAEILLSNKEE